MEYSKLTKAYDELLERIDQYFDCGLLKEPRAKANLEIYKSELLQALQIELWKIHKKKTYDAYDPEKLVWIKAKKIWISFTRKLKQKSNQKSDVEFTNLPENAFVSNFLPELESQNTFAVIESLLSEREIELLQYKRQGLSYNEIKKLANYPSAAAAKTKFNRMKKFIQVRLGLR